jgi:hypothetical protein
MNLNNYNHKLLMKLQIKNLIVMNKFKNKTITEKYIKKFRILMNVKLNYFNKIKFQIKCNYIINIIIKNRNLIKMKIIVK